MEKLIKAVALCLALAIPVQSVTTPGEIRKVNPADYISPIDKVIETVVVLKMKVRQTHTLKDEKGKEHKITRMGWGGCSGVYVESNKILTAAHCVEMRDKDIELLEIWARDSSGASYRVKVVGLETYRDLALLQTPIEHKAVAHLGSKLLIGEKVYAIGHPLGLEYSVSSGIVSQLNRSVPNMTGKFTQIDAAINPGNSGGPLFNSKGDLVGINSMIITPCWFGSFSGIALSASPHDIHSFLEDVSK